MVAFKAGVTSSSLVSRDASVYDATIWNSRDAAWGVVHVDTSPRCATPLRAATAVESLKTPGEYDLSLPFFWRMLASSPIMSAPEEGGKSEGTVVGSRPRMSCERECE